MERNAATTAPVSVFWASRKRPNFGDALAPILIKQFADLDARWALPAHSDAVVIGSIAGRLPRDYDGVVIGIGKFEETVRIDLSNARVLGLRGALTLRDSGASGDIVLGDPGLLAADLLRDKPPVIHPLGIIAHFMDESLETRYPDARHIDVELDPVEVIRQIAQCERVISSSLHGLIAADALGIPRRWETFEKMTGGQFKFHDYASALGIKLEPGSWGTAPAAAVATVVARLRDAFRAMPTALPAERKRQPGLFGQMLDAISRRVARA